MQQCIFLYQFKFEMKQLILLLAICSVMSLTAQDYKSLPFWNTNLTFEARANDIVSRLTLDEKVAQMINSAPAVQRLGIPAYDWWNEVLHGVARTPYKVTSYPQAIAMAATWDVNSLKDMAHYSALEGRAISNLAMSQNRNHERYVGLTYWTPNINIFRDPRWGRGQETYGEDPFLTKSLAANFVQGLQGNDPKYLKAAACAKHFAVHSGPEPSRHTDNYSPSPYDLWDTYLPAFEELITRQNVEGVMCAYNAFNGQPCCGSDMLMNDILRKQWKFDGYVTSDCWAIDDFFRWHKTHPDATTASVDAVLHGTDIECGTAVYKSLLNGVKQGMIQESQLDVSLRRLFLTRLKLGMFDPASQVPFANTQTSALEAAAHKAHALKMAQQSIVLLKNANNMLPLNKSIKKIAVIGPNADNKIAVLGNYNGTPSETISILDGLKRKLGSGAEIVYEKALTFTNDTLFHYDDVNAMYTYNGKPGVLAEYYSGEDLAGTPVSRVENEINNFWAEGVAPAQGIDNVKFSARFTTTVVAPRTGKMSFEVEGDDGYRVKVNDSTYVNAWLRNRWGARQFVINMKERQSYKIVTEFHQAAGSAALRLRPGKFMKTDMAALKNKVKDADVILFVGGISPQLEGEEMPVNLPGFLGGDRLSIELPPIQTTYMKELNTLGKPVIFTMLTGSAIACHWEEQNLPAIVNAWYGGQAAGTALADVLFGDYNPAGRLPVTFYKSEKDLPPFKDYNMGGRTYRYFKGEALYPFGYGLSYTTFSYGKLIAPKKATKGASITVTVDVTNSGTKDGDEVAQLYIAYPGVKGKAPIKALKGYQRVSLKKGETKKVSFEIKPYELMLVDHEGNRSQYTGVLDVYVGGGQPGVSKTTSNILNAKVTIK
jgi:beta-glucosidase